MVAISLYNLVDAYWVAQLGNQALAALTILMPFWVITIAVGAGTSIGANALASRRFGERKTEEANITAGQIFFLALFLGVVVFLIIRFFNQQILTLSGAPPDTLELGKKYILMLSWGMPFLFYSVIMRGIYHASGDTLHPMIFTIGSQLTNVILDPCFIFGWWIFPEMGVEGAALASVISMVLGSSLMWGYIFAKRTSYRLKPHHFKLNWRAIHDIYRVGLPSILMEGSEGVVFAIFFNIVGGFGSVVVAAVGIAGRISDLAFMFIIGITQGLLPIVGFSYGAKLWKRLWGSVKIASLWLAAIMAIATLIFEIFTRQIVGMFTQDPELIEIGVPGMRIFLSTLVLVGPTICFITAFQGLSKGTHAMVLAFTRQAIIFIPAILLLSRYMGLTGIWISLPISDVFGFLASGIWLFLEYRRQKKSGLWLEAQKTL